MGKRTVGRRINIVDIQKGDILQITWHDTTSMDRVCPEDINETKDPGPTTCWGIVVKMTDLYLYLASEIGDRDSDTTWMEMLPYRIIEEAKLLGHMELKA